MNFFRFRYILPIASVEIYLLFTLFVFAAGPVKYFVEDALLFWGFIAVYHVALVVGYVCGIVSPSRSVKKNVNGRSRAGAVSWILVLSALVAFVIGHKNISMSDSLIPLDLLDNVMLGLSDNQEVYAQKIARINDFSGDKLMNVLYIFFAYSRVVVVSFLVYEWSNLRLFKKLVLLVVSVLPVLSGLSVGTNKPIFDFAFIFGMSLAIYFVGNFCRYGRFRFSSRLGFMVFSAIAFFGAVVYFGFAMESRGGSADYIVGTSPLGHIQLDDDYLPVSDLTFVESTWVWLSSYLVQGYYGFSQALLADFSWTYGAGNSPFLARQVEWVTGVDLLDGTFPHKISPIWNEDAQWHSWYSHLASDLYFSGIAIFMALFGYFFAVVWKSYCDTDNRIAPYLLPLFGLAFIFTPANNQVFGFMETFSAFVILSLVWARGIVSLSERRANFSSLHET